MAISPARLKFRRFLYVLLGLSVLFMGTMGYYRSSYKRAITISPLLFHIDATQLQTRAYFANPDQKYEIALVLYNNRFFSNSYADPAYQMIDDLIADNHAPSQTLKADYLIRSPHYETQQEAIALYELAAAQNHQPAIDAMENLKLAISD